MQVVFFPPQDNVKSGILVAELHQLVQVLGAHPDQSEASIDNIDQSEASLEYKFIVGSLIKITISKESL